MSTERVIHDTWEEVRIHTAKCDICDRRNKQILRRCIECSWSVCTPCYDTRGGNIKHLGMARNSNPTTLRPPTTLSASQVTIPAQPLVVTAELPTVLPSTPAATLQQHALMLTIPVTTNPQQHATMTVVARPHALLSTSTQAPPTPGPKLSKKAKGKRRAPQPTSSDSDGRISEPARKRRTPGKAMREIKSRVIRRMSTSDSECDRDKGQDNYVPKQTSSGRFAPAKQPNTVQTTSDIEVENAPAVAEDIEPAPIECITHRPVRNIHVRPVVNVESEEGETTEEDPVMQKELFASKKPAPGGGSSSKPTNMEPRTPIPRGRQTASTLPPVSNNLEIPATNSSPYIAITNLPRSYQHHSRQLQTTPTPQRSCISDISEEQYQNFLNAAYSQGSSPLVRATPQLTPATVLIPKRLSSNGPPKRSAVSLQAQIQSQYEQARAMRVEGKGLKASKESVPRGYYRSLRNIEAAGQAPTLGPVPTPSTPGTPQTPGIYPVGEAYSAEVNTALSFTGSGPSTVQTLITTSLDELQTPLESLSTSQIAELKRRLKQKARKLVLEFQQENREEPRGLLTSTACQSGGRTSATMQDDADESSADERTPAWPHRGPPLIPTRRAPLVTEESLGDPSQADRRAGYANAQIGAGLNSTSEGPSGLRLGFFATQRTSQAQPLSSPARSDRRVHQGPRISSALIARQAGNADAQMVMDLSNANEGARLASVAQRNWNGHYIHPNTQRRTDQPRYPTNMSRQGSHIPYPSPYQVPPFPCLLANQPALFLRSSNNWTPPFGFPVRGPMLVSPTNGAVNPMSEEEIYAAVIRGAVRQLGSLEIAERLEAARQLVERNAAVVSDPARQLEAFSAVWREAARLPGEFDNTRRRGPARQIQGGTAALIPSPTRRTDAPIPDPQTKGAQARPLIGPQTRILGLTDPLEQVIDPGTFIPGLRDALEGVLAESAAHCATIREHNGIPDEGADAAAVRKQAEQHRVMDVHLVKAQDAESSRSGNSPSDLDIRSAQVRGQMKIADGEQGKTEVKQRTMAETEERKRETSGCIVRRPIRANVCNARASRPQTSLHPAIPRPVEMCGGPRVGSFAHDPSERIIQGLTPASRPRMHRRMRSEASGMISRQEGSPFAGETLGIEVQDVSCAEESSHDAGASSAASGPVSEAIELDIE
ncbi:hypothetical protein K432DRAFT_396317 [Lepidopterella palustris CBS 459.81]|uniref:Uncharacterized protein n=1 Tax=Lepidopterella palustris CBS 459.81 TaxID=1314670 RepID=A0A8E2JBS0_9PEZI|nr:hypothetical protein K432DRAFT_396317 [Lepidopterella palustris CBS 459.81]